MKIRGKILLALLVVGIIPILVSFVVSGMLIISQSSHNARQSISKDLNSFKNEIYNDMDLQRTYSSFFSRNIQIQKSGSTYRVKTQFLMTALPFDIRLLEVSRKDQIIKRDFKTTSGAQYVTEDQEISTIWSILSRPLYHRYFTMSFPEVLNHTLVIRNASIINNPKTDEKTGLTILSIILDSAYLSKLTSNYPNVILFSEVDQNLVFSTPMVNPGKQSVIFSLSNQTLSRIRIPKKGTFYIYKDSLLKLPTGKFVKLGILYNSNRFDKVLSIFKQIAIITFLISTFIAVIISFVLARKISIPILNLTGEVVNFKDDFKAISSPASTKDEIGILHNTFSEMSEKIIRYRETIEQYNNQLTNEVEEKTHDLLSKIRGLSLMNELSSFLIKNDNLDEQKLLEKIPREISNLLKLRYIAILSFENQTWNDYGCQYSKVRFPNSSDLEKMERIRIHFSEKVLSDGTPFLRTFKEESFLCYPIYFVDQVAYSLFVVIEKRKQEFLHEISGALTNMIAMKIYSIRLGQDKLQSEKLASLGQFAGTIIHDIKNPLTVIKSYIEVLVDDDFSQKEKTDYKNRLLIEIDRLTDMLNEILDYSKGDLNLQKEPTQIDIFIKHILQFYKRSLNEKDIQVNLSLNSNTTISIDQSRFRRSFGNIINNAIDALPIGGTLSIRSEKKMYTVLIVIEDNGPGIPFELQNSIFQPFVTYGKKDGTGLGLSITKKIIENHGGNITFKSTPGKGTAFYISLPL